MISDAIRCSQVLSDALICTQMLSDALGCCHLIPDALRCCHRLPHPANATPDDKESSIARFEATLATSKAAEAASDDWNFCIITVAYETISKCNDFLYIYNEMQHKLTTKSMPSVHGSQAK